MAILLWMQESVINYQGFVYMETLTYVKLLAIGTLAFGFTYWFIKLVRSCKIGSSIKGTVTIVVDDETFLFDAFVDSGNSLRDPTDNAPVILIDTKKAKEYTAAMEWYQKAAEAGNTIAMKIIGHMYYDGIGVRIDGEKAWEWYQKAADAGDAGAIAAIGWLYKYDKRDYAKAMEWYEKGVLANNEEAKVRLENLKKKMATKLRLIMSWKQIAEIILETKLKRNLKVIHLH